VFVLAVPSAAGFVHSASVRAVAFPVHVAAFHRQPRFEVASQVAEVVKVTQSAGEALVAVAVVAVHWASAAAMLACADVKVQPASAEQLVAVGAEPGAWAQLGVPVQCSHACTPRQDAVSAVSRADHVHPLTEQELSSERPAQEPSPEAVGRPAQLRGVASLADAASAKTHPVGQLVAEGSDHEQPLAAWQAVVPWVPHAADVPAPAAQVAPTAAVVSTAAVAAP
jgi:hypothetical protein